MREPRGALALALLLIGGMMMTTSTSPGHARSKPNPSDEWLRQLLFETEGTRGVAEDAERHRLQVLVGTVEPGGDGPPILRPVGFRVDAEYFYPASTVKMFAAIAALEKLHALREETGLPIDVDTPLVFHPLFEGEELRERDPTNVENERITVRHLIRQLFLVSDNEAFNRLYELVGQDGLHRSTHRAGLDSAHIVHRLSVTRSAEENRRYPRIDLGGDGFRHTIEARTSEPVADPDWPPGTEVGDAYLAGDQKVEGPMDFTTKNYVALRDLQRGLCMVVRPDVDCGGAGFRLDDDDRELLYEAMTQLPRESVNPVYDPEEYPDDFVKFLLPGVEKVVPRERLAIYNKIGQAYGFMTENAWVVDEESGRGFFVAATLYVNEDGVLNDDQYEYDEVAAPFYAALGEALARELLAD